MGQLDDLLLQLHLWQVDCAGGANDLSGWQPVTGGPEPVLATTLKSSPTQSFCRGVDYLVIHFPSSTLLFYPMFQKHGKHNVVKPFRNEKKMK